jgi:hypothetical protein
MQRLEVSGAVRLIYRSLGVEGLKDSDGRPTSTHGMSGTNSETDLVFIDNTSDALSAT